MKTAKIVYVAFMIVTLISCNYEYRSDSELKSKAKNINGVIYTFSSFFTQKSTKLKDHRNVEFNSSVEFSGLESLITKNISSTEFEKKLNFNNINSIRNDSISFTIDQEKKNIDLIYYLTVNDKNQTVVFNLSRNKDKWELK